MITNKHILKVISTIMIIGVCLCLIVMVFAQDITKALGGSEVGVAYETELFATDEIISIDIRIDEDDWKEMLANATAETYYKCDLIINGETFSNVGIRPKGNTSLLTIASDPDTDRYSFKIEFDHYVDGQTCFGLDKLVLNNNYADATNMKEALIYDMYQYLDTDASLYNYAKIEVNGEYWGVYLALEAVEDSFMLRNYGTENGFLYKPDSMNMDMGDGGFENGFSMFSNSDGANLNYSDDNLESYSAIWDGAVNDSSTSDHKRVVEALKNIYEGNDLEKYMDVDNILKYMAVHVFSVNEDSLSGMMAHNYYLYEHDGQLNIIPWDYNLALGGMSSGSDATSVVNSAIDEAFQGTEFFDTLMENEEYRERYYEYLSKLANEYILGDGLDRFYETTLQNIEQLVKDDPTAFYSYEEFTTAYTTLYELIKLRAESINGQLSGSIPSLASEQKNAESLIDASHLDMSSMGSMNSSDSLFSIGPTSFEDEDSSFTDKPFNDEGAPEDFDFSNIDIGDLPDQGDQGNPQDFFGQGQSMFENRPDTGQSDSSLSGIILYGVSFAVMIAALVFAFIYKRRPRKT